MSLSRRRFIGALGAATLDVSQHARAAEFHYRLGSNQPLDSPNHRRMLEIADRVRADTAGRLQIDVHGASSLGNDNKMIAMLQSGELEMMFAGNVLGPLVPVTEMPGLPF